MDHLVAYVDEPDDVVMLLLFDSNIPLDIPFTIIAVSPSPTEHAEFISKFLAKTGSGRKMNVIVGAKYTLDGTFSISDSQSAHLAKELKSLYTNAKDESINVILTTPCYALMHNWQDDWIDKIHMIYHQGGLDIKGGPGFNWKIGMHYAHEFMTKIPQKKVTILETDFYVNDMMDKFKMKTASICPRTFKRAFQTLENILINVGGDSALQMLVDYNHAFVKRQIDNGYDRFYPDKDQAHLWFCPADILLGIAYLNIEIFGNTRMAPVKLKQIPLEDKTYTAQCISGFNYQQADYLLEVSFLCPVVRSVATN
jgi:hypothetical protein